ASPAVRHYFDNLLPDDHRIRERLMRRFSTQSAETFDLLRALGGDCAGAVQIFPPNVEPLGVDGVDGVDTASLTTGDVAEVLRAAPTAAAPILARGQRKEDLRV